MKKLILIVVSLFIFTTANSQRLHVVPYYNWSNKTSYMVSPSPLITGYGALSDSLSRVYDGTTFYEYNDEYYPINSWADYYFWYVNRYWYQFNEPELYEYFYYAKDDYGMAQYICGANYYGRMYPSRIALSFPGQGVYINNLSRYRIRRCIKTNDWENGYYIADREYTPKKEDEFVNRKTISENVVARNSSKMRNNRQKPSKYNNIRKTQLYKNSRKDSNEKQFNRYSTKSNRNYNSGNNRNSTSRESNVSNSVSRSNSSTNKRSASSNRSSSNSNQTRSSKTIKVR